jgi:hypothetical protein
VPLAPGENLGGNDPGGAKKNALLQAVEIIAFLGASWEQKPLERRGAICFAVLGV